jgi:4-amino-4-deoxychorismate lyase
MDIIETLLFKNGKISNLEFHLKRVKNTCRYYKWKFDDSWKNIEKTLKPAQNPARVRITYNHNGISSIEYFPIKKRNFKKFKVTDIDFNYFIKKKNRKYFESLFSRYPEYDEFILIKNSLVTDTTISNLAFFDGKEWLTPKYPLLKGTKRDELLQKGFLKEINIHKYDLKHFKKIAMLNAIIGFKEIENFDIIL